MSISVQRTLQQNNGLIRLIEVHDPFSTEVVRNSSGENGQGFEGVWISGLTQTTYLGIPDTEIVPPLHRAIVQAVRIKSHSSNERLLCAAFDADSGGNAADIPALVAELINIGVSMVVIEDKELKAPGKKVNSLLEANGAQSQADPQEFAKTIRAFKKCTAGTELMVTARIESFNVRISKSDINEELISVQASLQDALSRAAVYTEAGADAIMIHSKSSCPMEVLEFLKGFRESDPTTPLVVVPTAYSATPRKILIDAGANIVIYANHLMRAKLKAIEYLAQSLVASNSNIFNDDKDARACLDSKNYGCLLRLLLERDYEDGKNEEAKEFLILAQKSAIENMGAATKDLALGPKSGCEADARIVSVKELLDINAIQVAKD